MDSEPTVGVPPPPKKSRAKSLSSAPVSSPNPRKEPQLPGFDEAAPGRKLNGAAPWRPASARPRPARGASLWRFAHLPPIPPPAITLDPWELAQPARDMGLGFPAGKGHAPPTRELSPGPRWPRCGFGSQPWKPRPLPPTAPNAPSPDSSWLPPRPACLVSQPLQPATALRNQRSP